MWACISLTAAQLATAGHQPSWETLNGEPEGSSHRRRACLKPGSAALHSMHAGSSLSCLQALSSPSSLSYLQSINQQYAEHQVPNVHRHLSFLLCLTYTCTGVVLQGGPLWTLLPCPSPPLTAACYLVVMAGVGPEGVAVVVAISTEVWYSQVRQQAGCDSTVCACSSAATD